jgi:4-hydroxythreonine-4-phosphate dehydrogenase
MGLRRRGLIIEGPVSSDSAIVQAYRGNFDCVIAMYHDQAIIPLKLTDFASGVNMTLGLPFVRTSVLHGTAFDIAAHPLAVDARSLVAAVAAAVQCTQNQKKA